MRGFYGILLVPPGGTFIGGGSFGGITRFGSRITCGCRRSRGTFGGTTGNETESNNH